MFYGSAANFTTYHEDRGRTVPAEWTDSIKEAALLLASEWIDNLYGESFYGYPTDGFLQERQWPREDARTNTYPEHLFTNTETPDNVADATYEAAFRELTSPGALNVDFTPNKYNKASVDGAVTVEYAQNLTVNDAQVQIRVVDPILSPLLDPAKGGSFSGLSGDVSRQ